MTQGRKSKPFIAYPPDGGDEYRGASLKDFCDSQGLVYASCSACCAGRQKNHKGWRFQWLENSGPKALHKPSGSTPTVQAPPETTDALGFLDEPLPTDSASSDTNGDGTVSTKDRIRKAFKKLSEMCMYYLDNPDETPARWNPDVVLRVLKGEAEANGIDWSNIADERTPLEKAADSYDAMLLDPSAIYENVDITLDAMIFGCEESTRRGMEQFERYNKMKAKDLVRAGTVPEGEDPEEPPGPKTIAEAGKQWISRLRAIKDIRDSITDPPTPGLSRKERIVYEATRLLRFMLYVSRSDIGDKQFRLRGDIYIIGDPHVEMSMSLWLSREGYARSEYGLVGPGDLIGPDGAKFEFEGIKYEGVMLLYPPRIGKSNVIAMDMALLINDYPRFQMGYVHRAEKETSKTISKTAALFDIKSSAGKRNHSLYPYRLDKNDNNTTTIRVWNKEKTANPNVIGVGVTSRGQGNNLNQMYVDDVTHREDQTQAATRENIKKLISSTWLTRFQGSEGFTVFSGYPWHHEDVLWSYLKKARIAKKTLGREGVPLWVSMSPVGGPSTNPKFKSIWPEVYDAKWNRRKYKLLSDDSAWNANYMLDPISDENRIVRQVRLYDIEHESARKFIENGVERYVSCDPTAKGDGTGDKVGWVQAMLGQERIERQEDGLRRIKYEDQIRITIQEEFPATQMDLSNRIAQLARGEAIDEVFMEVVTGLGSATIEMLEEMHGIHSVTECGVGHKNKEQRLRAVAQMLENSNPMLPAVVLFPARRVNDENGNPTDQLEPLDEIKPLINYVINFKVASGYHSLDALTQMLNKCRSRLAIAGGQVSREARMAEENKGRMKKHIERTMRKNSDETLGNRRSMASYYNTAGV
ncbi:MAG: hypothetical protein JKY67_00375 [Pseudomonadales bacterium]|nr:hypothetical protein [Pseudomonadales bacterium]MBL4864814.1 hypothetical protein [Pseudomonadales bacterium]